MTAAQLVIMILYYAMTAYFGLALIWNFVTTRNVQEAVLYLVVLMPFAMRVLRLK